MVDRSNSGISEFPLASSSAVGVKAKLTYRFLILAFLADGETTGPDIAGALCTDRKKIWSTLADLEREALILGKGIRPTYWRLTPSGIEALRKVNADLTTILDRTRRRR